MYESLISRILLFRFYSQNYSLTLSTKDSYYSQVFIYTYGCLDLDFNKNSPPSNCVNQKEIDKVIYGENAGFRLKLFTSQFNTQTKKIQVNYRNDFVYALGNSITYTTLRAQKQVTSVKQGFFIQDKSTFTSPIAYEKKINFGIGNTQQILLIRVAMECLYQL
ncbi:hypothetical protein ABPG72_022353 [Tetrahymena utriculariae]